MARDKLNQSLQELRDTLDNQPLDPIARQQLEQLAMEIETKLQSPDAVAPHDQLIDKVEATILQFEAEHPRVNGILHDIMHTLSNMGI